MFTLFNLIQLLAIIAGSALLGVIGWNKFGMAGCVVGVLLGFTLGAVVGQLPLIVILKWMSRRFLRMTNEQLVAELRSSACVTPNIVLLELNRRGYDIQHELPFVLSLLASDEMHRRAAGWAALTSAFPEIVDRISDYNPTASTADCQLKCRGLLDATEGSREPERPMTRE
jgi:hypothetical protein